MNDLQLNRHPDSENLPRLCLAIVAGGEPTKGTLLLALAASLPSSHHSSSKLLHLCAASLFALSSASVGFFSASITHSLHENRQQPFHDPACKTRLTITARTSTQLLFRHVWLEHSRHQRSAHPPLSCNLFIPAVIIFVPYP